MSPFANTIIKANHVLKYNLINNFNEYKSSCYKHHGRALNGCHSYVHMYVVCPFHTGSYIHAIVHTEAVRTSN
jgi:hypothetical protein